MPGPRAAVVVLYHHPEDPAAFERYYEETHVPLAARHVPEMGCTDVALSRFTRTLEGAKPPFYRKAELWFDSEEALRRGIATQGFREVADDLANFATGGVLVSVAVEAGA